MAKINVPKKTFSVASLDASKLKHTDKPIAKESGIITSPVNGEIDVSTAVVPAVHFHQDELDPKTLTEENVYLVTALGVKVPGKVRVSTFGDAVIELEDELLPGNKYFFRFGNKLRNLAGKKVQIVDNSICFTTFNSNN